MNNAWNVQYYRDGAAPAVKVFEGDSPKQSGAVDFAKQLKVRGIRYDIISRRRGYPPPDSQAVSPSPGMLWCPYCIKWREFEESSIVRAEYETPALLRCMVCTISIMDYHVRAYNSAFVARVAIEQEIRRTRTQDKQTTGRKRRRRR